MFSRVAEILEISKQRLKLVDQHQAYLIDIERKSISEQYNKLLYEANYDVLELIQIVTKACSERVIMPFALKGKSQQSDKQLSSSINLRKRSTSDNVEKVGNTFGRSTVSNFMDILSARKLQLAKTK